MDREVWQATVRRVANSWTQLKRLRSKHDSGIHIPNCSGQTPKWPTVIPAFLHTLVQCPATLCQGHCYGQNYKFSNNFKIIYIYFL